MPASRLKAVEEDGIRFHVGMGNLERYKAVIAHIGSAKNRRHAAARNLLVDAVRVDLRTGLHNVENAHQAACSVITVLFLHSIGSLSEIGKESASHFGCLWFTRAADKACRDTFPPAPLSERE